MSGPLSHKRRVRISPDLPEPPSPRHSHLPVIWLGLAGWLLAVLVGAALAYPERAAASHQWLRGLWHRAAAQYRASQEARPEIEVASSQSAQPRAPARDAGEGDLVVREQARERAEGKLPTPELLTCEGAIRSYRDAVLAGTVAPPLAITEGANAAALEDGGLLHTCEVSDEIAVEICAAVRQGRVVGVTVQTNPHQLEADRCLAKTIRELELSGDPSAALDITTKRFDPRWQ